MGWSFLVEEVHVIRGGNTKIEFVWITMLISWIVYSFLLLLAFGPRSITGICYQINLNSFDFWSNSLICFWSFISFCLICSAISDAPQGNLVKNAAAWTFFAMLSTGALGAMLLEQVAIIPIPEWWPFTGLTIPEDDITGAPPPQPNTVNTVSEQVASQPVKESAAPEKPVSQPAQASQPPPQSDNVVDIFASTPTPAPTQQTSAQASADMFDFSAD